MNDFFLASAGHAISKSFENERIIWGGNEICALFADGKGSINSKMFSFFGYSSKYNIYFGAKAKVSSELEKERHWNWSSNKSEKQQQTSSTANKYLAMLRSKNSRLFPIVHLFSSISRNFLFSRANKISIHFTFILRCLCPWITTIEDATQQNFILYFRFSSIISDYRSSRSFLKLLHSLLCRFQFSFTLPN